jgi:hypothetical protein
MVRVEGVRAESVVPQALIRSTPASRQRVPIAERATEAVGEEEAIEQIVGAEAESTTINRV